MSAARMVPSRFPEVMCSQKETINQTFIVPTAGKSPS
jgi:hypothetical protein